MNLVIKLRDGLEVLVRANDLILLFDGKRVLIGRADEELARSLRRWYHELAKNGKMLEECVPEEKVLVTSFT